MTEEFLRELADDPYRFFASLVDSLLTGLLVTDAEGRVVYVNESWERMTGYRLQDVRGRHGYELLLPPEEHERMVQRTASRLHGESSTYRLQLNTRFGPKWFRISATPYRDCNGEIRGSIGAHLDIEAEERLRESRDYLQEELGRDHGELLGESPAMQRVREQIALVAHTESTVLILGETGTGKELVARAIHQQSTRAQQAMVRVNCAAIPRELFESEFFGHRKGAFTGALDDRKGRFELAHQGTLFLDEIGEVPLELQGKLLRVLQEREFERVGEETPRSVDIRIIAATHKDLREEAQQRRFREDLYYRLSVYPMQLPPLRERGDDVLLLARSFVAKHCLQSAREPLQIPASVERQLLRYEWPGNVRELANVIERGVILSAGKRLQLDWGGATATVPRVATPVAVTGQSLEIPNNVEELAQLERQMMLHALQESDGRIYGKGGAAERLGLKPTTLRSRLQRLGIERHTSFDAPS